MCCFEMTLGIKTQTVLLDYNGIDKSCQSLAVNPIILKLRCHSQPVVQENVCVSWSRRYVSLLKDTVFLIIFKVSFKVTHYKYFLWMNHDCLIWNLWNQPYPNDFKITSPNLFRSDQRYAVISRPLETSILKCIVSYL